MAGQISFRDIEEIEIVIYSVRENSDLIIFVAEKEWSGSHLQEKNGPDGLTASVSVKLFELEAAGQCRPEAERERIP